MTPEQHDTGRGQLHHSELFIPSVIFRARDAGDVWKISLGHNNSTGVLAWPINMFEQNDKLFFQPQFDATATNQWVHISHFDKFESMPVKWVGPAHSEKWFRKLQAGTDARTRPA